MTACPSTRMSDRVRRAGSEISRGYGAFRSPERRRGQALSENFWKVWQSSRALPRLTAKVQVTSAT